MRPGEPPANKGRRYPAETLTPDEVRRLIRAASGPSTLAVRNRAMITVTYRAALRVAEALNLRPQDVDPDAGTVRVLNGKGGRHRVVGISGEAVALLRHWLDRRAALQAPGDAPLFCSLRGTPLDTSYLRRLLPQLAREAGIERRVHPHILRHTRSAELAAEGVPVNVIQQALGHSDLTTTDRYLAHVAPVQVVEAMRSSDWQLGEAV